MKMSIVSCAFIMLIAPESSWSANSNSQHLKFEDLDKLISAKNEKVEAARLHVGAQEFRTGRLGRSFLPQISLVAGQERFQNGSEQVKSQEYWRIEGSINIYKGGRDRLENRIRNAVHNLSQTELSMEFQNELREARLAYWDIVALTMQLKDNDEALTRNEVNYKSAKRRAGAGLTTTADAKQFELHRISLEREKSKLMLERDLGLNRLSVAVGMDDHKNLELVPTFPAVNDKDFEILQIAPDHHLTVRAQKDLELIEQLKADQSLSWWQPKLDLYAGYGLPSLSDELDRALRKENEWKAGVRMTIDLGQGFEDQREAQARQAEAASFKKKAAHAIREGRAIDHELKHDMSVLGELIKSADQDIQVAEGFLKLTESEYRRGVKNGPDLLEAIQKYFEFRNKRISYYHEFFSTKAKIESLKAVELNQESN